MLNYSLSYWSLGPTLLYWLQVKRTQTGRRWSVRRRGWCCSPPPPHSTMRRIRRRKTRSGRSCSCGQRCHGVSFWLGPDQNFLLWNFFYLWHSGPGEWAEFGSGNQDPLSWSQSCFFWRGGERFVSLAFFAEMKIFAVTVGVKSLGILSSGVVSKGVSGYPIRNRVVFFWSD